MKVLDSLTKQASSIAAIRRDIHAHPELCFEEIRTADLVAQKLTEWGIPIHRGMGKTGVVGILKCGTSDRAIGLRADMDALPLQEVIIVRARLLHASHELCPSRQQMWVRICTISPRSMRCAVPAQQRGEG